ncbi:histidine kinase [Acinetobacter qingfengensis]|uniref:histidine kinase n=1 Tax=Acinetobacter qingfengensis TaxID=1262585 RepID=A0A1E7R1D8_9GAMM|nr:HAMP domain-containing sensor histidine kinase [Acinetobacter qingfengensis]KAA8733221.1 histidine kinase [Acinetobacter qingfengensis]OEY93145.1 hypothetical protein BJI46_05250 [Acinetobacter qingfengensis]
MSQTRFIADETLHRLGLSYTGYRLFLASGLLFTVLLTQHDTFLGEKYPALYFALCVTYFVICFINFFSFKFYRKLLQRQLFTYLIIDVLHLTIMLYISSGPNIVTILLFIVVVLAANMLLSSKQALALTLLSIIAVVYQQFFYSIFESEHITFVGTSSIITLVFLATYALGQAAVKRLHFVESIAVSQRSAIVQLQHINQNIIEQLDTGFMVIDTKGEIITFNESARTLLFLPIYTSAHLHQLSQIHPQLYHLLQIQTQAQLRGIFQFKPHPEAEELSIQYRPISSNQQQLTLLIIESLIKIDQQVQQLKLASLGQLSASIAHEIRNPLAAIAQANELLDSEVEVEQQVLTKMIQRQCSRINHIIEDTLNMSRQNQTHPEQIVLYPWLKAFIQEDLVDIQQYLHLTIEDKVCITFDPNQLRLVLINLIRNGIRHGHEKSPESQVIIAAHQVADLVFLDIMDQGQGVSERQRHNLFEPFYSTATSGTGLGLYLSKTFCEANHARLKYISQSEGACFRIECLPEDKS